MYSCELRRCNTVVNALQEEHGEQEAEAEAGQREIGGMSSSPLMQRAKLTRTSFLTCIT